MEFQLDRLGSAGKRSAAEIAVASAKDTVGRFLIYIRDRPLGAEIRNSDELPSTKRDLIDAFRLLIAHEMRAEQSGQLQKVGLYLAQFRDHKFPRDNANTSEANVSEVWEQVLIEQEKLEKLFKLSARYARREFEISPSLSGKPQIQAQNQLHS